MAFTSTDSYQLAVSQMSCNQAICVHHDYRDASFINRPGHKTALLQPVFFLTDKYQYLDLSCSIFAAAQLGLSILEKSLMLARQDTRMASRKAMPCSNCMFLVSLLASIPAYGLAINFVEFLRRFQNNKKFVKEMFCCAIFEQPMQSH